MKKVSIIMPKWIGDYIMALSVVEQFRVESGATVSLLTANYLVGLAKMLTDMEIITYKSEDGLTKCRDGLFDELYILPKSISTAIWGKKTGIPVRVGYKKEGRSPLLTRALPRVNRDKRAHITTEYCNLLDVKEYSIDRVSGVHISDKREEYVVLCPGAKYGPTKQWPFYSKFIDKYLKGKKIILLGSQAESLYADMLVKENSSFDIDNRCGKGTLEDAATIISNAKVIISNDSGLMHLSAYLNRKTIGIFGSTSPAWTRPIGNNSIVVNSSIACSPCFDRECKFGHYKCMEELSVDLLGGKIKALL